MDVDTASERERREAVADIIHRRKAEIEERWLQTVLRDVAGRDVPLTDLRDSIGDYIELLANRLKEKDGENEGSRGEDAWVELTREHAITRVRLGFDISQLVHEFIVLRRTMFDVAREEGHLQGPEAQILAEMIEAGIALAVRTYVEARDFEARQAEARHLGFVTHELRNPLATATLAAAQIRSTANGSDRLDRAVSLLERAHRDIRTLIDQFLSVERLEAGQVIPKPAETELGELLDPMLETFKQMASSRSVELRAQYDPHVRLNVDSMLTASAIGNLVENAIKYSSPGEVRVEVHENPSEIELHVRDHCSGLSPEELRVVFEPFRRGPHGGKGSGLGLAIARRAIEAQGGSIHAESEGGHGCHFWMLLPKSRN